MASAKKIRDNDGYARFMAYIEEAGFSEDLRTIARRHCVTLKETYLDTRGPTVYAARLESWWWLTFSLHKSSFEIGRIYDRNSSSILHALTRLRDRALELGVALDAESGHKVAVQISRELAEARILGGRRGGLKGKE